MKCANDTQYGTLSISGSAISVGEAVDLIDLPPLPVFIFI